MPYILSLVDFQAFRPEFNEAISLILCYYINNTMETQVIRVLSKSVCHFERIVFPQERILFEALSESFLDIYSPFLNGQRLAKIECKMIQVSEK
jgi:hypothetical protein